MATNICVLPASAVERTIAFPTRKLPIQIVVPGDKIDCPDGCLRGHGTHEDEDGLIYASVCGAVERVNKLTYVRPLKSKYVGEPGDVVVGRIDEIGHGKWYVDIGASQRAQLPLASINLPGSEQRRRTSADHLDMRQYFSESDVLVTEVQRVQNDGILLHTRSARYGRLENGCLLRVPCSLIRRQQSHIVVLDNNVQIVLGTNGFIWISTVPKVSHTDTLNYVTLDIVYEPVLLDQRKEICRIRNSILLLSTLHFDVTPESIKRIYKKTVESNISIRDILRPDNVESIGREHMEELLAETSA